MFASTKYVGADRGYFWGLWSTRSFARAECLDCGFADDLTAALHAIRTAPCARRKHIHLLDAMVAGRFYAFVWQGEFVEKPVTLAVEDRLYEAERFRFTINSPPAPPPPSKHRHKRTEWTHSINLPWWCTVLGLRPPCSREDIHTAFRARVTTEHPDHGGTSEGFIRLKRAYDCALRDASRHQRKNHGSTTTT